MRIIYGKDKHENTIPTAAYTSNSGFVAGTKWIPKSIEINKENNKYSYSVVGIVEWSLLGTTVYTQSKTFHGTILKEKTTVADL